MHVIEWVTKTVNRDGKNLRHLKSPKINLFQSFLYLRAFNLVFMCPTLCQLKTTCLLLMKQQLYALDAFFIEKLKLSENDPPANLRWIYFSRFKGEVENVLGNQEPGGNLGILTGSKNTNVEEDVEILLPVKFCSILFRGFRGEVETISVNQMPWQPSCFPIDLKKTQPWYRT